jgi:transposase
MDGPNTPDEAAPRFVGLDVHRAYVMVGAVNARQETVLHPHRVALLDFDGWIARHLRPRDVVAREASANAWDIHDRLVGRVARVTVAHPRLVQLIGASPVKTDARDALTLARLLAASLPPAVWVPPPPVRALRALVAHRRRLVGHRTQARNRLHGVLHRHNLVARRAGRRSRPSSGPGGGASRWIPPRSSGSARI